MLEFRACPHPEVRLRLEAREEQLSPLAAHSRASRGRVRPEADDPMRTDYQRDRDRIIHCKAFRRLKHKTQVFIAPLGDHYRTRLTHTLEVMQVARSVARALNLNEELAEAISLGHDLGHTPFGHAGEDALAELLPGGFRHNEQSIRVVELLEKDGEGLNLTQEVKDGILKHSKARYDLSAEGWGVPDTLEGQVVKVADGLAYLAHDVDDAIRAGVLQPRDLPSEVYAHLGTRSSRMINTLVVDIVDYNWRVAEGHVADWRQAVGNGESLTLSPSILVLVNQLRDFMFDRVYLQSAAKTEFSKIRFLIQRLFDHFCQFPDEMPVEVRRSDRAEPIERQVADYIAGMTDRYALATFNRLFVPQAWPEID